MPLDQLGRESEADAGDRERDDADEQRGHVEGLPRRIDQEAEAGLRAEQLTHHYADDAAADAETNSGEDKGQRGWQHDLGDDLSPAGAETLRDFDQQRFGRAHAGDGVDEDRKD